MATNPGIIGIELLNYAPYGAYAVNLSQIIWYWNPAAERITGHKAQDVIGLRCNEIVQMRFTDGGTPVRQKGHPFLQLVKEKRIPSVYEASILHAAGDRKLVTILPMIISAIRTSETVLLYLFHEKEDGTKAEQIVETAEESRIAPHQTFWESTERLTKREVELLKLTALGMAPREIAEELQISYHTVRNHTAAIRGKLRARNRLNMVRIAHSLGII